PLASITKTPFGLGPNGINLLPSAFVVSAETRSQVPTSCSLSVFCWAGALLGRIASPNAAIVDRRIKLRRFICVPPLKTARAECLFDVDVRCPPQALTRPLKYRTSARPVGRSQINLHHFNVCKEEG